MRESLKKLVELQEIDSKLKEIEELRGNLPQEVERLKEEITSTEDVLANHGTRIKEIDVLVREHESDIESANEKLKKYQEQIYAVKTNKEYDALTHELEAMKSAISESENIILALIDEKDQKEEQNESARATLEDFQNELETKEKELSRKISETEKEEKAFIAKRKKLSPEVSKPLLRGYERIRSARNGVAVVPIVRNACGGCFHRVPPQLVVEIKQMDKIIYCESCGRLLVAE